MIITERKVRYENKVEVAEVDGNDENYKRCKKKKKKTK